MKNPFEKKQVPQLHVDDDIPIFVEKPMSQETIDALEQIEKMKKDLAELKLHASTERDRQNIEYLENEITKLEESKEISEKIL